MCHLIQWQHACGHAYNHPPPFNAHVINIHGADPAHLKTELQNSPDSRIRSTRIRNAMRATPDVGIDVFITSRGVSAFPCRVLSHPSSFTCQRYDTTTATIEGECGGCRQEVRRLGRRDGETSPVIEAGYQHRTNCTASTQISRQHSIILSRRLCRISQNGRSKNIPVAAV